MTITDSEITKILEETKNTSQGTSDVSFIINLGRFSIRLYAGEYFYSTDPSCCKFASALDYRAMMVRIFVGNNKNDSLKLSNVINLKNDEVFKNQSWSKYFQERPWTIGCNVPMTDIYNIIRHCHRLNKLAAFI